jgi:hypothetical protein
MLIEFSHPRVEDNKPLQIEIGPEEVGWGYVLNTAEFSTYGGEVIQILSVYVDDLMIAGNLFSYNQLEKIYHFFLEYMIIASQGYSGDGSYVQTPMLFKYPHRQWEFEIQPLAAPGFTYELESISPQWEMQAHIVDRTPNAGALTELIVSQVLNGQGETFSLTGFISPDARDPDQNPFAAPGTVTGNTFTPLNPTQVGEQISKIADWYNNLIPSYLNNEFQSIIGEGGAEPASGKRSAPAATGLSGTTESKSKPEQSEPGVPTN